MTTAAAHGIGLAMIGCGTVGRIRAVLAREYPGVSWLGLCDVDEVTLKQLDDDTDADFSTTDVAELLARPEVSAVIIATDEREHVDPILRAADSAFRCSSRSPWPPTRSTRHGSSRRSKTPVSTRWSATRSASGAGSSP